MKACSEAGEAMTVRCSTSQPCYPCAYAISYLFSKYEKNVDVIVETVFKSMSERTAAALMQAKDDAG